MRITLITGGVRSGKSDYAQRLAEELRAPTTFIATAEAGDDEMAERIAKHRGGRPSEWVTVEARREVGRALGAASTATVIIDCITLLVSNVMLDAEAVAGRGAVLDDRGGGSSETDVGGGIGADTHAAVDTEIAGLLAAADARSGSLLLVTNEVGLGVVPATPLGRRYRDLLGAANRRLAEAADRVVLMVSGIPLEIKDEPRNP